MAANASNAVPMPSEVASEITNVRPSCEADAPSNIVPITSETVEQYKAREAERGGRALPAMGRNR